MLRLRVGEWQEANLAPFDLNRISTNWSAQPSLAVNQHVSTSYRLYQCLEEYSESARTHSSTGVLLVDGELPGVTSRRMASGVKESRCGLGLHFIAVSHILTLRLVSHRSGSFKGVRNKLVASPSRQESKRELEG